MKTYTIVSTFPEKGSRNIGDKLITEATKRGIRTVEKEPVRFNAVFREADFSEVQTEILSSDAIVFACLALRHNMETVYPYADEILKMDVPVGVLAAGTKTRPGQVNENLYGMKASDVQLIKDIAEKSLFFGTRDLLTQDFCEYHDIESAEFTGDIAFFDERFQEEKFSAPESIQRIAVSDPHYSKAYTPPFEYLLDRLKDQFPQATTEVFIHGKNPRIVDVAKSHGIKVNEIYKEADGLKEYEDIDLHVGFRLHGHVSALTRRKPSYLFEQDGRGCGYGLALERKTSVPCFRYPTKYFWTWKSALKFLLGLERTPISYSANHVPKNAVDQIMAMVIEDSRNGFQRFNEMEEQILQFNERCIRQLNQLV